MRKAIDDTGALFYHLGSQFAGGQVRHGCDVNLNHATDTFQLLWPVIGNSLPTDVSNALWRELDRLGTGIRVVGRDEIPSEATQKHSARPQLTHQGLLAAYYHRDRIEGIETEVIRRIRAAPPEILGPGATASGRMPVVGHEFVAYLLAARRTLDYLARGQRPGFDDA